MFCIKRQTKRSFTLIELLIVIAIIGILTAVIVVVASSARKKGRDSRRKFDLQTMKSAVEMYYSDYKQYPSPSRYHDMMETLFTSKYIDKEIVDPTNVSPYKYRYSVSSNGLKYEFSAKLETDTDGQNAKDSGDDPDATRYEIGNAVKACADPDPLQLVCTNNSSTE